MPCTNSLNMFPSLQNCELNSCGPLLPSECMPFGAYSIKPPADILVNGFHPQNVCNVVPLLQTCC
jgi:hypothetical protein